MSTILARISLGEWRLFTVSANPNTILKGIEKKSSQADGVLVQVNLSEDEMSNIAKRMWGKQNGKNIKVIIFKNSSGNIFEFKR